MMASSLIFNLLQVVLGIVEDEATDIYFGQTAVEEGIGEDTRDRYLRTLIRNTYNYHMNEIFATVQNEYIDWNLQGPLESEAPIRPRRLQMAASRAITDKLYLAPLLRTANWCNQSAFQTFFYLYSYCDTRVMLLCFYKQNFDCCHYCRVATCGTGSGNSNCIYWISLFPVCLCLQYKVGPNPNQVQFF